MENKQKITTNIKVPNNNMEVLKKHFGQCFNKNGNFDIEKFKQALSENEIDFHKESYGLDWLGKSYARILASDEVTTLLKEDEAHNQKPENNDAQNLLIKGDNLEVLKHLTNAYYEKIKMIYIDPPYNTGGDGFVYQDDRKFTVAELQQLAGLDEDKAKRILNFTQSKSNSHSAWLTFMYPRLYIAKQLLKEDGVIFISIDDNEVAQLRILMDEIFGEENFIADFLWKKKGTTSNVIGAQVSSLVDNTLCYGKTTKTTIRPRVTSKESRNYPFIDEEGAYRESIIEKKDSGSYKRDSMKFEIIGHKPRQGKRWQIGEDKAKELESKHRFRWDGEKVKLKIYDYEDNDTFSARPNLLLNHGSTDSAANHIESYFGIQELFDNPKPIELINELISISSDENNIILDFFAGSGTTGDAVMQLNAKDRGSRKYILVQLPEPIDKKKNKTAYDFVKDELKVEEPTIFEITKERLIRASKKINAELDEKTKILQLKIKSLQTELPTEETKAEIHGLEQQITKNHELKTQNYFKILKTMPIWDDYDFEADELDTQTKLFDENSLTHDDLSALLITWKTYDGVPLTEKLSKIDLGGYKAYFAKEKLYLMDKGFATDNLVTLLETIDTDKKFNPKTIIAFGYHFESKNLREISENIKSYANKKNIDIDFITRY